ncbi:unnamed protein product [Protopolystoma xenopodis]|uniref:Dynein heavy chain C-terminal domain-containing protein n=1 Tax=Protopolystoma xenopodis TaxID=117903 RepID=A0A448XIC1_9PLAT|nr:unnamed protein product [Protopolystoma xenopodis]
MFFRIIAFVFAHACFKSQQGIDWKCTRYMIGEIQYGGRVTDDFDSRLLITLTRAYFQEMMFSPDFEIFTNYPIPRLQQVSDYLNFIANDLPARDAPEVFGLHSNAEITYSTQTTCYILSTIVSIQPKDSSDQASDGDPAGSGQANEAGAAASEPHSAGAANSSGVETREAVVHRLCTDMLSKLPSLYNPFRTAEQLEALGNLKPMTIFLRQEVERINKVLQMVLETVTDLRLAIDGTVVMNEMLRDALDCIYDARVPGLWMKVNRLHMLAHTLHFLKLQTPALKAKSSAKTPTRS